jgi:small membrane protein
MILAQPILIALLAALLILYFARLRTRAWDILAIGLCFGFAALLVVRPTVATSLAHAVGIGRGVDLIVYLAIPGLALLILLLFAKTRELNSKLTAAIREIALANPHVNSGPDHTRN